MRATPRRCAPSRCWLASPATAEVSGSDDESVATPAADERKKGFARLPERGRNPAAAAWVITYNYPRAAIAKPMAIVPQHMPATKTSRTIANVIAHPLPNGGISLNHAPRLAFLACWAGARTPSIRPSGSVCGQLAVQRIGV